jgi:integrase/recombinase XerD
MARGNRATVNWTEDWLAQYAPTTRTVNDQVVREFTALVKKPIEKATQDDVVNYAAVINGASENTRRRKLNTLSAFFKYWMKRGALNENPTIAVRIPKPDNLKTIQWLTEDEVDILVSRTSDIMARAVLYAGLSGLRLAEIQSLTVDQFRDERLWNVLGKGNKVRTVPLTQDASQALSEYIGDRTEGVIFPIPRRTLQKVVYEASKKALGRRISPHVLRHSFATMAARADIPVMKLGRLLGHANPAITEIYIHLTADDLADEVAKLSRKTASRKKPRLLKAV